MVFPMGDDDDDDEDSWDWEDESDWEEDCEDVFCTYEVIKC